MIIKKQLFQGEKGLGAKQFEMHNNKIIFNFNFNFNKCAFKYVILISVHFFNFNKCAFKYVFNSNYNKFFFQNQ